MEPARSREPSLYNGVSNRSRGWKTRRSESVVDPLPANGSSTMRWDGAARSMSQWDNLRRDPELWYREGDCYVHLYGKGQSRRGPAFKIPLSVLLEANCLPLLERFMVEDNCQPVSVDDLAAQVRRRRRSSAISSAVPRLDLYLPAPPQVDKQQSFKYHLATRNFFAFVFKRSMVGEHLGEALITLMHSLCEFRSLDCDNVQDMMDYMDEEGYLEMRDQPAHALAVLHLAEVFQLRALYVEAFAHCCGMSDQLFLGPEYQLLSSVTRKLIRRSRAEMDNRLMVCSSMLSTLLQDDLSEAYLGLQPGARAHLDRFRTLIHGFYAARLGYYPPASVDPRGLIFDVETLQTMREDFESLFEYLVDERYDTSKNIPRSALGGICTLQTVQAFDSRHKWETLEHPLPLLPEVPAAPAARRLTWLGSMAPAKLKPSQRANIYAALLQATNRGRYDVESNDLVKAYRQFEEDTVFSPLKADKQENLGTVDGRKIRWILIYTIYHTLRQATEPPPEVTDYDGVPYHLCISTAGLPPWRDPRPFHSLVRRQTEQIQLERAQSVSTDESSYFGATPVPPSFPPPEIKPDVDYLAIHQRDEMSRSASISASPTSRPAPPPSRKSSIGFGTSRRDSLRRSLSIFNRQSAEVIPPVPSRKGSMYHEIVVHGYGNGTNNVNVSSAVDRKPTLKLDTTKATSPSTSATSATASDSSDHSHFDGSATTGEAGPESPTSVYSQYSNPWDNRHDNEEQKQRGRAAAQPAEESKAPRSTSIQAEPSRLPRGTTLEVPRASAQPRARSKSTVREAAGYLGGAPGSGAYITSDMEPPPLNIRKFSAPPAVIHTPFPSNPYLWDNVHDLMEAKASALEGVQTEWEQYNHLGGFKVPEPAPF